MNPIYEVELSDEEFAEINRQYDEFVRVSREDFSGGREERS